MRRHALRPFDRVEAGRLAPAMGKDLPFAGAGPLRVDGDDDALAAEALRPFGDEFRPVDGGGVDRRLVGAGEQQLADVVGLARSEEHTSELQSLMRISYAV